MKRALIVTAALALAACSSRTPDPPSGSASFRRIAADQYCMALAVYARPDDGHLVGRLITASDVDGVPAVNITVNVDGEVRSVWRRQSEVLQWYVRTDDDAFRECKWERVENWTPSGSEFGLDQRIWLRRRGGWTADRTRGTDFSL